MGGKDGEPILISLKEGYQSSTKKELKVSKRANILDKRTAGKPASAPGGGGGGGGAAETVHDDFDDLSLAQTVSTVRKILQFTFLNGIHVQLSILNGHFSFTAKTY